MEITWTRHPWPGANKADYGMYANGELKAVVRWCGHPTALRPYFVVLAGEIIEEKFRTVALAKAAAEAAYAERHAA